MRLAVLSFVLCVGLVHSASVYEWMKPDRFDDIIDRMDAVNEKNCASKSAEELRLPSGSVSNPVLTNKLKTSKFQSNYYRNRTSLLQLHQIALSNAYKYSFLFQRLNQTWNFPDQPSLFYYYLGLTADVTANLYHVNGSAIFFDQNMFYPNFLTQVPINTTIPLFGPRAWRIDNYNDPSNWLREPTNDTFRVTDYGAGYFRNYTRSDYKLNQWYDLWLADKSTADSTKFFEMSVDIKYAKELGVEDVSRGNNVKFFGPPVPSLNDDRSKLPVVYTTPYFDCGRSNKWIVSAVAPIYDRLARYVYDPNAPISLGIAGIYDELRENKRVGVAVADTDFLMLDINPCGSYPGDDGPNYFSGIDRCHKESTICKPLLGFGFQRGGYMCECRPGYRYPEYIQGPYFGLAIERATEDEYNTGFHCIPIGDMYVVPELNAEKDDNSGIERLPGSVINNKKKRSLSKAEKLAKLQEMEQEDRKRRDVGEALQGLTKYASATQRFRRRVIPRKISSIREVREARFKEKRVPDFSSIPEDIMIELSKRSADLGMGSAGRKMVSRYRRKAEEQLKRNKRSSFSAMNFDRAQQIFDSMTLIKEGNCLQYSEPELTLPGDTKFGADKKLERFGRTALRLADFLSSFLQNIDGNQDYGILKGDKLLKEEQLFAEVLAVVLADPDVRGIGLFFDTDQFKTIKTERADDNTSKFTKMTRQLFAPYGYRKTGDGTDNFYAVDRAVEKTPYTEKEWFKNIKRRWLYNTEGLKKYTLNPWIRSNVNGTNIKKHEDYPLTWMAPVYESGEWSDPYFDCEGYLKDWIITYRIPFFGNRGYGSPVEFRGVVLVDIKLELLDLEQCPSDFFASNAFMGTAQCDFETTYCNIIENQGFQLHQGYRCDCKQGYEFPWKGAGEYFYTGDMIEDARQRHATNQTSRYGRLQCRMSSAHHTTAGIVTICLSLVLALIGL